MKRTLVFCYLLLTCSSLLAQKKKENYQIQPSFSVSLDGDLQEWSGKMYPIDADSSWTFGLTQDADFLYLSVQVKQTQLMFDAVRYGILLNVNADGKKKDGARLIFPSPDSETLRALANNTEEELKDIKQELIKRTRGFAVKGFAHIVDGLLSYDNSYGVLAVAKLDNAGERLKYEAKIPIQAIGIKDRNKPVAIQVQIINRFTLMQKLLKSRPMNTSMYGGMYGRPAPSIKTPYKVKTEVWLNGKLNEQ